MQKDSKEKWDALNFEKALKRLEEIVHQLESGEPGLEDALRLFEEGVTLARLCNKRLEMAEKKIEMLTRDETGEQRAMPADIE
ncbi:MAG: exodeoxyribonuclease VII small subunit [bacterium]